MSIVTRFDYEKDNVTVFKKKNKNSSDISFCGRGIVTAPYRVVAEFVKDVESTFLWDKYLVVGIFVCYTCDCCCIHTQGS